MVLKTGEKIHVISRRRFPEEVRRHFAGEVKAVSESVIRAEGYVFVFDSGRNEYLRREDRRNKIVSLADSGNIINVIPKETALEDLCYELKENRLVVTDGKNVALDINEFGAKA